MEFPKGNCQLIYGAPLLQFTKMQIMDTVQHKCYKQCTLTISVDNLKPNYAQKMIFCKLMTQYIHKARAKDFLFNVLNIS